MKNWMMHSNFLGRLLSFLLLKTNIEVYSGLVNNWRTTMGAVWSVRTCAPDWERSLFPSSLSHRAAHWRAGKVTAVKFTTKSLKTLQSETTVFGSNTDNLILHQPKRETETVGGKKNIQLIDINNRWMLNAAKYLSGDILISGCAVPNTDLTTVSCWIVLIVLLFPHNLLKPHFWS